MRHSRVAWWQAIMLLGFLLVLLGFPTLAFGQGGAPKKHNSVEGPYFIQEPSSRVDFTNKTGVQIRCTANGKPPPEIAWSLEDGSTAKDLTGLRLALPDGSLVFPPFRPEEYRQDVHAALYRCSATNTVGTIISRDVHVKAVLAHIYDIQVYDEFVIRGNNTGILKCHIQSFFADYIRVTGWIRDNAVRIDSTSLGKLHGQE
uniref:Ig-like domain-containing protein n=1 Tax=Strigamia maritima TaxID=126957 RepID=T1IT70_STRMM